MEVVWTGTEAADHETISLESLVHRWRLVDSAYDRLEVHDVEGPWVEISIPAYHIEGVVIENDLIQSIVLLDQDPEIAALVMGAELSGATDVALAVGSAFDQLPELI